MKDLPRNNDNDTGQAPNPHFQNKQLQMDAQPRVE